MCETTASMSGATQALLSRPARSLSDGELSDSVGDLLVARERLEGALAVLLAEIADRGLDGGRPRAYVTERAPAPLTGARVHRDLRRVRGLDRLPLTMRLLLDGQLTAGVLDAGVRGTTRLPEEAWPSLDGLLAGVGSRIQPDDVDRLVEQCLAMIDPDRLEDRAIRCQDELRVDQCGWGPDTSWELRGRFHGTRGEQVASILNQLARHIEAQDPGQLVPHRGRMAEALLHAVRLAAGTPEGAPPHGADAHVIILVTPETLAGEPGAPAATTATGSTVARSTALAALCTDRATLMTVSPVAGPPVSGLDAALQAEIERLTGQLAGLLPSPLAPGLLPLDLGRTKRVVSPAQWLALIARDRTCRHPGCRRPPGWCQAHHRAEWHADDGPTDLDNLVLLCHEHHAQLHARDEHLVPGDRGDGTYDLIDRTEWDRRRLHTPQRC